MNTHPTYSSDCPSSAESKPLATVIDIRSRQSKLLSKPAFLTKDPDGACRPYIVKGNSYVLDEDGLIHDAETDELVYDPRITDKVLELHYGKPSPKLAKVLNFPSAANSDEPELDPAA